MDADQIKNESAEGAEDKATDATSETDSGTSDKDLGSGGEKALKAERKRADDNEKALKALQAEIKALKDKDRPESEVLSEKISAAEERAVKAEQALWRAEVALEKGLTPAQARRLVGENKAELMADADDLVTSFAPPATGQGEGDEKDSKSRRPKENLKPGASTQAPGSDKSAAEIADEVFRVVNS